MTKGKLDVPGVYSKLIMEEAEVMRLFNIKKSFFASIILNTSAYLRMNWVANDLLRGYSITLCNGLQYSLELQASNDKAEREVGRTKE